MANVLDRLCEMHNFLTSSWHGPNISEIAQEQIKVYNNVVWVQMEEAEPHGSQSCTVSQHSSQQWNCPVQSSTINL